jgi:hypothetical protein
MFVIVTVGHDDGAVDWGTKVADFKVDNTAAKVTAPPAAATNFRKSLLSMPAGLG